LLTDDDRGHPSSMSPPPVSRVDDGEGIVDASFTERAGDLSKKRSSGRRL
jgi:hypothetical protein